MAVLEDKIQALMDEVYSEWQKEENNGKSKWDVLDGFSAAHQIAVVFGNFNYQVENGGISQWIYNGYFHDDADKFIEYLEIGAKSDERCRTILDRVYALDQYAKETDCDRYGSFYGEDDESGFIGDTINCDAFDTWYYKSCDDENWWQIVSEIIDKVEGREPASVSQAEHESEITAAVYHPLRVYIENIHDDSIGGFTMPLPTTMDALQPFLDGAEITGWQDMRIWEVRSEIGDLGDMFSVDILKTMSADMLDELNYLAAKIQTMSSGQFEVFAAALEAKRHCGSVAEIINLTFDENINRFDLLPAFTNEQYGEFLIEQVGVDVHAEAFNRLETSDDSDDKALAKYIEKLEEYVDRKAYGRDAIKEENGALTENGLMVGGDGIEELYRGSQDIPAEYRIFTAPGEVVLQPIKLDGMDIAATIMKLQAISSGYMESSEVNLKTLVNGQSSEFILFVDREDVCLLPAEDVYKRGSNASTILLKSAAERPDVKVFDVRVTDRDNDSIIGDFIELNAKALQASIIRHGVTPDRIDAVFSNGALKSYDLWAWAELPSYARDDIREYEPNYPKSALMEADRRFASFVGANEMLSEASSFESHLSAINSAYMAAADYPRSDMIRIAKDAAVEILARGEADIYRLIPAGAEKLAPIEATRLMRYTGHVELAIKREDVSGLDKWAKNAADNILRQNGRGDRDKTKNKGEEL